MEKEFALIGSAPRIGQTSLLRSLSHSSLIFNDILHKLESTWFYDLSNSTDATTQSPANRTKRVSIPRFRKIQSTKENVAAISLALTVCRTESYGKASYVHLKCISKETFSVTLKQSRVGSIGSRKDSFARSSPHHHRASCEFFPRLVVRNCIARKREIAAVVQNRRPKEI